MDDKCSIAVLLVLVLVGAAGLLVMSTQQASTGLVSHEGEGILPPPYAYGQTGASCRQDSDCAWICAPQDVWCGCLEHKCAYYVRQP